MLSTYLHSIKPLSDSQYEVIVVGDNGTEYTLICSVISSKGITGINISPDITTGPEPSPIDVRKLAGAVVKHHKGMAADSAAMKK